MNKVLREKLRLALEYLSKAATVCESVKDREQTSIDNYPENLQGTEKYEQMEDAVDSLDDAISAIDEAVDAINSVM